MKRVGFIGAGHICEILVHNLIARGGYRPEDLSVYDTDISRTMKMKELFAVETERNNDSVVTACDFVFICVRPDAVPLVLREVSEKSIKGKIFISVTAGIPISIYENTFEGIKVVRILPNPPSRIGEGTVPVIAGNNLSPDEKHETLLLTASFGSCFEVGEDKIDIFTSVTSPAPVYAFFEAMIDAAVLCGLDAVTASAMVYQTIKGCLQMWREEDRDIHGLIVEACTPAGTSVESLRIMDQGAFRSVMKEAYYAAWEKSRGFGRLTD